MAESEGFSADEVKRLLQLYRSGGLEGEEMAAFEQEFPHLIAKSDTKTPKAERSRWLDPIIGPMPSGSALLDSLRTASELVAPMAASGLGAGGGLALGTGLAARAAPYLGRVGQAVIPPALEALGSYGARRLNVAAGTEEEGTGGDVLATAPSLLRLARPIKQAFVRSLPDEQLATLRTNPKAGESASEMLLAGKGKETPYVRGKFVQEALEENEAEINNAFGPITDPIKKAVGPLDLTQVEQLAKRRGLSLADAESGIEVERGTVTVPKPSVPEYPLPWEDTTIEVPYNAVTFDRAWHMRSRLQRHIHALENTDPGKSRDYTQIFTALDQKMNTAVNNVGMGAQWDEIRQLYKSEFADRFRTKLFQKITDTARTSGEELIASGFTMPVEDAKSFAKSLGRMSVDHKLHPRVSHQAFRTGMLSEALESSVDEATGLFNPRRFFQLFNQMPKESREALMGPELASAVMDFGKEMIGSVKRLSFGIGSGGAALTAATAGAANPAFALSAAAETANEFKYLAGVIAARPSIMNAIKRAVLMGSQERLTRITGTDVLRIGAESVRPPFFGPAEPARSPEQP